MSRIGKQPINIPDKVKITFDNSVLVVEGPKGKLELTIPKEINLEIKDNEIIVKRVSDDIRARSFHGLFRSLINNMVVGVTQGFKKELDIIGIGYRAQMIGNDIIKLYLGYSHPIEYFLPEGIKATVQSGKGTNRITIEGIDKQLVGEVAAQIRRLRPPEPYKGKGIRYVDEVVRRKAGKSATAK